MRGGGRAFRRRRLQPGASSAGSCISRSGFCRSSGGVLGEDRERFGGLDLLAGAAAACRGLLPPRRLSAAGASGAELPPVPPTSTASAFGAALRLVRVALFGASGAAASSLAAVSSLTARTWSLSICGDTPAPDVPPHPAPIGAYICQNPQALTEVNWIPSGSHRQWGAAALEGRRRRSETRCSSCHNQVPSNGIAGKPGSCGSGACPAHHWRSYKRATGPESECGSDSSQLHSLIRSVNRGGSRARATHNPGAGPGRESVRPFQPPALQSGRGAPEKKDATFHAQHLQFHAGQQGGR